MTSPSTFGNSLRDINLNPSRSSMALYKAQRNAEGEIIDFRLVSLNAVALAVWGRPEGELVGRSIHQLMPDEEARFLAQQFSVVITFGRRVQFEMDIRWQPGGRVHQRTFWVVKEGDAVVMTSQETGSNRPAEDLPDLQTELLHKIIENSSSTIEVLEAVRGTDGKIEDFVYRLINKAGLTSYGMTEDQVIGQRLLAVYPDAAPVGIFDRLVTVVETGKTDQQEIYFHANDCEAWIDTKYLRHNDGVVTINFDITAARLAEREQRQQSELYKTILDTALTSIAVLEAVREEDGEAVGQPGKGKIIDFRYTLVNQERLRLAGQPESYFIGKRLTELFPGMRRAGVFDRWVQVIETGQPQQFELHYVDDGYNDWSLCLGSPFGDRVVVSYTDITKQKNAELEALQQTELLKSIQNTSQIGMSAYRAIRDSAGFIIDFQTIFRNETSASMFHRPVDDISQTTLLELVPSLRNTSVWQRYLRVVETGKPEKFEDYYKVDDVEGWFEISVQPWGDGIVVNSLETTELRRAIRDKLNQTHLLQQVVNNTQLGLLLARPVRNEQQHIIDFEYVLTNEYNARTTGRTVAEMTGARVADLFPGWQDSDLFSRYVEVVETGQAQRLTFPYEAYGMKGWFDGSFVRVDDSILYTYIDVTSHKEAELLQQQNAELLEKVMNTTPTSIVVHQSVRDEAGEIVDFRMTRLNQVAADLLKKPIEKIQYRRISKYFPGLLETPLFDTYREVVRTGIPTRAEVPWADRWFDFSVARLGDGIVVAVQDVTFMYEYRHKLEVANLELRRSNENLQSFAFVSSHDLQEPLRKIISFADILQTQHGHQFGDEVADIIHRINTSADRMRLLIQDLLAYSKVETRQDLFKPVNLTKVIQELQEHELWVAFNRSKAQLHLDELPTLTADPIQMRQLFQNLLSNAIKFSRRDVKPVITISSRIVSSSELPAGLLYTAAPLESRNKKTSFYEISVADNGIGFDEKYVDRIFQIFQRLHGRSQHSGSGIGLAICYKIVERHGGAITANSLPGAGSTFRVYLPVRVKG